MKYRRAAMAKYTRLEKMSTWRKVAIHAWGPPRDPTAYGTLDLDCTEGLAYLKELSESSGEKLSLSHLTGKAVAIAIAEKPEINAFVSGGHLMLRDSVDVFYQVAFFDDDDAKKSTALALRDKKPRKDSNLAGAKVAGADKKDLVEIARELRERAEAIRNKSDAVTVRGAQSLARLPSSFVGYATRLGAYLSYDWNMNLSSLGIPYDAFGSVMVTNVGTFGILTAYAPLVEMSRVGIVLTLGAVRDAPSVHEGQLCIRKRVTIGVAFDHRVMDGYHAGVMAKRFSFAFEHPREGLVSQ